MLNERWGVLGWRILQLEQCEKDLKRATNLIARLRAENNVLKKEHKAAIQRAEERIERLPLHQKFGAIVTKLKFMEANNG